MNINNLVELIVLSQEEIDFNTWAKNENVTDIHLGQKVKIYNKRYFIVGGSLNGNIYLQEFPAKTSKLKIRFDKNKSKVIIHWNTLKDMIKDMKS